MTQALVVCGLHAAKSALQADPEKIQRILIDRKRKDRRMQALIDQAHAQGLAPEFTGRDELERLAEGQVHQGVVVITRGLSTRKEADIPELLEQAGGDALVLVLDGVTDPHNLGACLRTAEAAGVAFVIAPKDRAAGLNATARKAASGAAERLAYVQVTNLARTLRELQQAGLWITGTAMEGEDLYQSDLTGPRVIVMGSEGKGMRRLTREHCDQLVHIPMQGEIGSLNVSVATGVVLFEVARQRYVRKTSSANARE